MIFEAWVKWRYHKFCELYCKDCIEEEFEDEDVDAIILLEFGWSIISDVKFWFSLLSCFRFLEVLRILTTFICNENDVYI